MVRLAEVCFRRAMLLEPRPAWRHGPAEADFRETDHATLPPTNGRRGT
jgi:hypothetical protein